MCCRTDLGFLFLDFIVLYWPESSKQLKTAAGDEGKNTWILLAVLLKETLKQSCRLLILLEHTLCPKCQI